MASALPETVHTELAAEQQAVESVTPRQAGQSRVAAEPAERPIAQASGIPSSLRDLPAAARGDDTATRQAARSTEQPAGAAVPIPSAAAQAGGQATHVATAQDTSTSRGTESALTMHEAADATLALHTELAQRLQLLDEDAPPGQIAASFQQLELAEPAAEASMQGEAAQAAWSDDQPGVQPVWSSTLDLAASSLSVRRPDSCCQGKQDPSADPCSNEKAGSQLGMMQPSSLTARPNGSLGSTESRSSSLQPQDTDAASLSHSDLMGRPVSQSSVPAGDEEACKQVGQSAGPIHTVRKSSLYIGPGTPAALLSASSSMPARTCHQTTASRRGIEMWKSVWLACSASAIAIIILPWSHLSCVAGWPGQAVRC